MSMLIEMVEWRQSWTHDFVQLKPAVLRAAPARAYLHHIGSTAVAGLAAKNVINIQVTVENLAHVDSAAFANEGFIHGAGLRDHCPLGLELADCELAKLFYRSAGRPANIHVREKGRFNQRFSILCRDFLRTHPSAATAYASIKQRLALRFPTDAEAYYDIKDPVFDLIIEGANEWAKVVGWSEPPGD